jgi:tetratricopeptide (TPR) repeat protein
MWIRLAQARDRGDVREAARLVESLGLLTDTWWMLGPFDNEGGAGMRRRQAPELAASAPLPSQKSYTGKNQSVAWRRLPPVFLDGLLRPGELLESPESSVLLLRTDIVAPRPLQAALRLGTSGPYRLYCNGALVGQRTVTRPLRPDQDNIGVSLVKGRNALLLVVGSEGGAPEAVVRITAPSGGALPGWSAGHVPEAEPATRGGSRPKGPRKGGARIWPQEPPRGNDGDGVTVVGAWPKPEPGPKVVSVRQALEDAAKRLPKDPSIHAALARFHLAVSPDDPREERALASARTALSLGPSAQAQLLLARCQGQTDAQRQALGEALRLDPLQVEALFELAEHDFSRGRHHRAEELFRKTLAADPGFLLAELRLAELALVRRMPSLARGLLVSLLERYPGRQDAIEQLAAVEQELGLGQVAVKRMEALLGLRRTSQTLLHRLLAMARTSLDGARAEHWLGEMVKTRPDWMWAREELASSLAARGAPEEGIRTLKDALSLAPRSHRLQRALARVALRAGLVPLALGALKAALEIRPQDLAAAQLRAYLERQGPDPLVSRSAVDALTLAKQAWAGPLGKEDAEVLHQGISYDVLPSGLSRRFAQQVVLIHNRKGVEAWSSHHLDYLPDTQHLEVRVARIIRRDGSEVEAARSDVSLGDPSARLYYDRRLMVIRFGGLRPGDALEIQTLLSDIPAGNQFKDYFGALIGLGAQAPVRHLRVAVKLPPGRTLHVNKPRLAGLAHRVSSGREGTLHLWEAKGIEPVQPEPMGPGWAESQPYLHISTFRSWPEVARWYWGLVKEQFHSDDALRMAAREATRGATTAREKVLAIYHLVVKKTRYVALAFGMHTYKPYSAPQVFARKFGDCKDKAMLMAVMLREVGIESHPALVRTRPGGQLGDHPPSLAVFDHAILFVPALDLWLDGTAERTGSGELPWADQGVAALVIDGKDGRRTTTPVLPARANQSERSLELVLSEDGTADVVDRLVISGQEAPWWRRSFTDPQTRRREFQKLVGGVFPRAEVSSVQMSNPDALEQPVTIEARYRVPGLARIVGENLSLDLGLTEAPLSQQFAPLSSRTQPVEYRFPFSQKVTVTLRWPKAYRLVKAPPTSTIGELGGAAGPSLAATQSVAPAQGRLTLARSLEVKRHRFSRAEYPALRRFWVRADQLLGAPLVLGRSGGAR